MKVWYGLEIERTYYNNRGAVDSTTLEADDDLWTLRFSEPGPYNNEFTYSIIGGEKSIRKVILGLGSYSLLSNGKQIKFSRSQDAFLASGQPDIGGTFTVKRGELSIGSGLVFAREPSLPQNRKLNESFVLTN